MSAKRTMPTKLQIINYWVDKIVDEKYWLDAFYDAETSSEIEQTTSICFACGGFFGTQRCHITPKWYGGIDAVENLHLLCPECHLESESITDKEAYYKWFSQKNPSNSSSFHRFASKLISIKYQILAGKLDCLDEGVLNAFSKANVDLNQFAIIENEEIEKLSRGVGFMFA